MQTYDLTEDSKTILLLCGVFGENKSNDVVKPLVIGEYNKLISALTSRNLRPSDILDPGILVDIRDDIERICEYRRIEELLKRGVMLAFALENWLNSGIWAITRAERHYPMKLRNKFGNNSPPIIFGVGDTSIFDIDGLAVVGSRNVDIEGENYAREIGRHCAQDGISIVSGGARGVDRITTVSALAAGGTAVGVLTDGLMRSSLSSSYRDAIVDRRLLLISPFNPNARFSIGNAMARNKYVYALSSFSLIISAEMEKGGTWAGAIEELKRKNRSKVFVRAEGNIPRGNQGLLKLDAFPFPEIPWKQRLFTELEKYDYPPAVVSEQTSMFDK